MKRVLILGTGMVARPLVHFLLDQPDVILDVASLDLDKAKTLINNHARGYAILLNVDD
mgnify:FL=1